MKRQAIVQYTLQGEPIQAFSSMSEAAQQTGIPKSSISRCCSGILKSTNKHTFRLKKDYDMTPGSKPIPLEPPKEQVSLINTDPRNYTEEQWIKRFKSENQAFLDSFLDSEGNIVEEYLKSYKEKTIIAFDMPLA